MPVMKISKATWQQVLAEEEARRIEYGNALRKENEEDHKSLRQIARERGTNHVQVSILIDNARKAEVRITA